MKFATLAMFLSVATVAYAQEEEATDDAEVEDAAEEDDACECLGPDALPADFFVEQGYDETYGSACAAWDSTEDYCLEGGDSFGEDWCAETYLWCYVDPSCEGSDTTIFFEGTDYADTLNWTDIPCAEETSANRLFAAVSAAIAVAALAM